MQNSDQSFSDLFEVLGTIGFEKAFTGVSFVLLFNLKKGVDYFGFSFESLNEELGLFVDEYLGEVEDEFDLLLHLLRVDF